MAYPSNYARPAPVPQRQSPQRGHRECDNCGKTETALTGRFSLCAQCKIVQYCSKDCQRSHWASHKAVCQVTAQTVARVQHEAQSNKEDYPSDQLPKYLRKFCSHHASLLAWVAYQALELRRMPANIRSKSLLIEIEFDPSAPQRFKLVDTHFVPRSYLSQYADPTIVNDVSRRESRCRAAGGIGTAVVLLQCRAMCEVMPVEIDSPARLADWEVREDWEEILEWYIMAGRSDFKPPVSTSVTVRNHRY